MFKWKCEVCGRIIWNSKTCECGNTLQKNNEIYKQKKQKRR